MDRLIRNKYIISLVVVICLITIGMTNNLRFELVFWENVIRWFAGAVLLYSTWLCYDWVTANKANKSWRYKLFAFILTIIMSGLLFFMMRFVITDDEFLSDLPKIYYRFILSLILLIFIQFSIESIDQARKIKLRNMILEHENLGAQYRLLVVQVNPHFLFNSLSTLRSMIRLKDENSEKFVLNLSDLYREFLKKRDNETATLGEELELLNSYYFMLEMRFENMLTLEININKDSLEYRLPVFSLITLLENCVKHNIISSSQPLRISIFQNTVSDIIVKNTLKLKSSSESMGIGLKNLEKRYDILGEKNGLSFIHKSEVFGVKLKLLTKNEYLNN